MRKKILLLLVVLATFSFFSCTEDVSNQMSSDYPTDYDINYELRQVLQYDPMNIDGIDIVSKLDFFKTLRFTLHYENGKITKVKFNNGSVPFSPLISIVFPVIFASTFVGRTIGSFPILDII